MGKQLEERYRDAFRSSYDMTRLVGLITLAVVAVLYAFVLVDRVLRAGWPVRFSFSAAALLLLVLGAAFPVAVRLAAHALLTRVVPGRVRVPGMMISLVSVATVATGAFCVMPMTLALVAAVLERAPLDILPGYVLTAAAAAWVAPRFEVWPKWLTAMESPSRTAVIDARRQAALDLAGDLEASRSYRKVLVTAAASAAIAAALLLAGMLLSGSIVHAGPRLPAYRIVLILFALVAPIFARLLMRVLNLEASAGSPLSAQQVSSLGGLLVSLPVWVALTGAALLFVGGGWPDLALFAAGLVAMWAWLLPRRDRFLGWVRGRPT